MYRPNILCKHISLPYAATHVFVVFVFVVAATSRAAVVRTMLFVYVWVPGCDSIDSISYLLNKVFNI